MSSAPKSAAPSSLLSLPRLITLACSLLVALSSGTNYVYSAYAPQLGSRLRISHTKLNIVALAGNVPGYVTGPIWGRIVDSRGPRFLLASAFILLLAGYYGVYSIYDKGLSSGEITLSMSSLYMLVLCEAMTAAGGSAGLSSAINSTAKSFPDRARATTTGLVISGFGLSAFLFSSVAHLLFAGNTANFLLVLALGTSFPMILGFFFVRAVPLPPSELALPQNAAEHAALEEEIAAAEASAAVVFPHEEEGDDDADDRTALLRHASTDDVEGAYTPPSPPHEAPGVDQVELSPSRENRPFRSVQRHAKTHEGHTDIYRWELWTCIDFWILFVIMSLLAGTGLMYINNVGSISQALFAKNDPDYDEEKAARWQAAQVSTISIANWFGRILAGLGADFTKNRLREPRTACLALVALLFVISQFVCLGVDDARDLWRASALLGLAYGGMFGLCPAITIEYFGLAHFSENWGYLTMSPAVGGNVFSLAFGRNFDAHLPTAPPETPTSPSTHPQCLDGRLCYSSSLHMTIIACFVALLLALWAGYRDRRKMRAHTDETRKDWRTRAAVVWDGGET